MSEQRSLLGQPRLKKVVIVDDSRTIRGWLRSVLERENRLEVVGEAGSADEARSVIKQTNPDVITLDIEMPGMNGLTFLSKLMKLRPMPVVMLSGATQSNSEATIAALTLGAIDCILKPTSLLEDAAHRDIANRVYVAACSQVRPTAARSVTNAHSAAQSAQQPGGLVVMGASTGGVTALGTILAALDPQGPPIVIVQHMPGQFLVSFARQLAQHLPMDVALAAPDEALGHGQVRIAPGMGQHTEVHKRGQHWFCTFRDNTEQSLYTPSVDALFRSAVPFAPEITAVILTGLGRDGAHGMQLLAQAGAVTIGQDEATSTVYGMPKAAWSLGAVQQQFPLPRIAEGIMQAARRFDDTARKRSLT